MGRMVSFVILAVINAGFTIARAVDAVAARGGGVPRFSLLLPIWMQPETRITELIALGATPALSIFLPILMLVVGVIDFFRRRKKELSTKWSKVLVAAGSVCLVVNGVTTYLIYTSMPSF
ncbi:hypothetical protein ACFL01_02615 [Planctomycetota bacterium]